ncbi:ATP-binding protein [Microbacterium oryzae]|uniref:Sensor-like histidine kinase SenX3 n=1 Tax=Microbacterium oryzae TaxID=743009 RepID=A0A6I6DU58_9MICO|nr:ATP-binding protein [Microbacterium oryzae]QGU28555.1 two-component sensor histidine kinase [Microbacterium oryzae]
MHSTQLGLLALALGILLGVGVTLVVVLAFRARERALREQSRAVPPALIAALDVIDDASAIVDASGAVVAVSAPGTWLGLTPGQGLHEAELRELVKAARLGGGAQTQTMRIRRGRISDESRLVVARAARIADRLTLLIVRDISEQERLQQMRQDFIANTSHELKTPVGAIGLLAEAMDSASDDPDQVRRFAGRMSAEARRLGELTARIMNLSKLQAADELTEVGDVAIDEVVAAAIEQYQVQAGSAEVVLVRGGDRGLHVRGSATILVEALGNLIANAIAYSPRGSRVGIGVRGTAEAVEIAVTDQGIGIAEADQQRVFERFYRADQARSRRTGGTGLGLAIVKHAVSRHGGEVRLWSQPDRGSTFTIRLPRTDAPLTGEIPGRRKKKGSRAVDAA